MDRCQICLSARIKPVFGKHGYDYFRCDDCAMLLVDLHAAPAEVFAHYSESYYEADASGVGEGRRGYPSYRNARETLQLSFADKLAVVRRHVPSGRLLDAGAAYGLFLLTASPHYECVGIDVSEYAASVARSEFGMNVNRGDLERTEFPDEHFDAVVMWDIVEHLIHPVAALDEVRRILKPGGRVFISTDDAANWLPRLLGSHWWALGAPMHLCHFSKAGMKQAFRRAGLEFEGFSSDPRRYGVAEVIRHFGVSYQSDALTRFGHWMEKNPLGRFAFYIARPEQFIAIGRKPAAET